MLPPGSRLDNEIDLAAQLNLSRPTMRKAMDELVRSGLLVRKRGVGTQVVSSQVRRPLELSSLFDDLSNNGSKPTTEVLSFSHDEADAATRPHSSSRPAPRCTTSPGSGRSAENRWP